MNGCAMYRGKAFTYGCGAQSFFGREWAHAHDHFSGKGPDWGAVYISGIHGHIDAFGHIAHL